MKMNLSRHFSSVKNSSLCEEKSSFEQFLALMVWRKKKFKIAKEETIRNLKS
jgi:hypothetical protein